MIEQRRRKIDRMESAIELQVFGRVGGSGSKSVYPTKKTNGSTGIVVAPASKYQKPWMESVKWAFLEKYTEFFLPLDGAIRLWIIFYLPRPKGHYKKNGELTAKGKRHPYPDKRIGPDLTKAIRSTEDALNGLAYTDDKRVTKIIAEWQWRDKPGSDIKIDSLQELVKR